MTTTATHLPVPYQVRTLLEDLFGRPVEVRPGPPWAPLNGELGTLAVYVDDRYTIRTIGSCDLHFSAYAGAAIGLVPRAAAHRALRARKLDKETQENLEEVLEIATGLYNVDGAPQIKLHHVCHLGTEVAPQVRAMSAVVGRRLDLTVDIRGYGTGRLSFVNVA
jgi:hypothetical protein